MPDQNDITYNEYSLDFFGFIRVFFQNIFGSGGSSAGTGGTSGGVGDSSSVASWLSPDVLVDNLITFWNVFTVFSWLLSALLIFGIIYAYIRDGQLSLVENEGLLRQERLYAQLYGPATTNKRWEDVETHISTDNPNDWKLAIIEADIMLEDVLKEAGYAGLTIGDKLKSASPVSFTTLDQAWRAHKVRNQIAHAGPDFVLTKRLAQETIAQYKMVFEEFNAL